MDTNPTLNESLDFPCFSIPTVGYAAYVFFLVHTNLKYDFLI